MALVAVLCDPRQGDGNSTKPDRIIAVSRYITNPDSSSCEFSLLVADDYTGKGIGSRMMRSIMDVAREKGMSEIIGLVLAKIPKHAQAHGKSGICHQRLRRRSRLQDRHAPAEKLNPTPTRHLVIRRICGGRSCPVHTGWFRASAVPKAIERASGNDNREAAKSAAIGTPPGGILAFPIFVTVFAPCFSTQTRRVLTQ